MIALRVKGAVLDMVRAIVVLSQNCKRMPAQHATRFPLVTSAPIRIALNSSGCVHWISFLSPVSCSTPISGRMSVQCWGVMGV